MMKFLIALVFLFAQLVPPHAIGATRAVDAANTTLINLLDNPGAELGKTGWTITTDTFSVTTTAANVSSGSAAFSWDSAGAGRTFVSNAKTTPVGLYAKNGAASCNIQTPSGTATHTMAVYDVTTSTVLNSITVTSSANYVRSTLNFVFPATTDTIQIKFTSVNANEPQIYIDDCVLADAQFVNLFLVDTSVVPLVLPKTSGTNTAYTPTAGTSFLRVKLVGGGGGGGAGGTSGGTAATDGGTTCFGTNATACTSPLLQGNGGTHGVINSAGGAGGTTTAIAAPAYGTVIAGANGSGAPYGNGAFMQGSPGGGTPFGGGGGGGQYNNTGGNGTANTGGGGGGGGVANTGGGQNGAGAGGGAYAEAIIPGPLAATYYFTVGGGGSGQVSGGSGGAGGAGGTGYVEITEYYTPTKGLAINTNAISYPTVQIKDSGTAATYTLPTNPRPTYIIVEMLGAGGSGGSSGTGTYGSASNGDNSTWSDGVSTNTATGGGAGSQGGGGAGGTNTINFGTQLVAMAGNAGAGGVGAITDTSSGYHPGGKGGEGFFGGGCSSVYGGAGGNATANSGGGGCGAGGAPTANIYMGSGGGAGAYQKVLFTNPASTYTYTVGVGKTGGTNGTNGYAGGNSAAGRIIVTEFYGNNAPILVGGVVTPQNSTSATVINNYVTKSGSYTLTDTDETVNFSATATATLPTAVGRTGKKFTITNTGGTTTLATTSSQTIGGVASGVILLATAKDHITVQSDGANWFWTNFGIYVHAFYQGTPTGTLSGAYNYITYPTKVLDTQNNYSGYTFTATIPGMYQLSASMKVNASCSAGNEMGFYGTMGSLNTSDNQVAYSTVSFEIRRISHVGYLAAGGTLYMRSWTNCSGPSWNTDASANYISVTRLGD